MNKKSHNLTLEELENNVWEEPEYDSHLVKTCHELRKIPLCELTVENIRMLIGQKIGLEYITPIALEYLEENPWSMGDFYDGDLLVNVLKIDKIFWNNHLEWLYRLSEIMVRIENNIELYHNEISPIWIKISKEIL